MARIGEFEIYEGTFYKAYYRTGNGNLNSATADEESVETIRKLIDRRNEWARYNGEAEENFCIVRVAWNKITYPDGTFRESHETKTMVELYPADC